MKGSSKNVNIIVPQFTAYEQEVDLFSGIDDITPCKIILPDPPNKNDIQNHNLAMLDQKWIRPVTPEHIQELEYKARKNKMTRAEQYAALTIDDHNWIMSQYDKLKDGHFMFINGKITYITGYHYIMLSHWRPQTDYLLYLSADRRWYYHWDDIEKDDESYGMVEMAGRRARKSTRAGVITYLRTFTHNDRHAGIQSKTDPDAEAFLKRAIISPWRRMPFYLQPVFSSSTNPNRELKFEAHALRGKSGQDKIIADAELNSWIEVRSSIETAFDGSQLHTYVSEEPGKTKLVNVCDRWEIVKPCLEVMGKIIGKSIHPTTVEDMERLGGKNFKKLWLQSNEFIPGYGNRTVSGLRPQFTPAYDGYLVDEFGNSRISESIKELDAKRAACKGSSNDLIAEKRRHPYSVKEALQGSGKNCPFNAEILNSRIDELTPNTYVGPGTFEWKNGFGSTVKFIPSKHGKFKQSFLFKDPAESNQIIFSGGLKRPKENLIMGGGDPYNYQETDSKKQSDAAGSWFMGQDIMKDTDDKPVEDWESHRFVCSYRNRPTSKNVFGEDMLKACLYYGSYMFPETNVSFIWDYFVDKGYRGMLYHKLEDGRRKKAPGATTNDNMKDTMFSAVEHYIDIHGHRDRHDEILEAFRDVEYDKMSPHDLFVASAYALVGSNMIKRTAPMKTEFKEPIAEINYL